MKTVQQGVHKTQGSSTLIAIWRIKASMSAHSEAAVRYAYGVLTALFVFEFVLAQKQGELLSGEFTLAFAATLGRMAGWQRGSLAPVQEAVPNIAAVPFPNLMR